MDIPFSYRVATLLALMALVAGIDRWRRGAQSVRYLEYGYIVVCGVVGSAIGAANDFVTSGISPEYFIIGKGLNNAGPEAVVLGLKTGFSGGVIAGALCLFATGRRRPRFARMLRLLVLPVASALLAGAGLGLLCGGLDPMGWATQLAGVMSAQQLAHFQRVWWIHTGLYSGLGLGVLSMIVIIRRHGQVVISDF